MLFRLMPVYYRRESAGGMLTYYVYLCSYFCCGFHLCIYILLLLFGGVLSSHQRNYKKFSLITIDLMSLRSRSHVKASMVLTRADHLFIHNYLRSFMNNILRPILMVRGSNSCPTARVSDALANGATQADI